MRDDERFMDGGPRGSRSRGSHLVAALLALGLMGGSAGGAKASPGEKPGADPVPRGRPLAGGARAALVERVLSHPGVARRDGQRVAVIRLALGHTTDAAGVERTVVTAVLFDHAVGEARRVAFDADTGQILADRRLPGRPQGSPEEADEAARIVRRDPELGRLLAAGAVLDGGFIVEDPRGSRHRIMQLKLLGADRLTLLRSLSVDLTASELVPQPEHAGGGGR